MVYKFNGRPNEYFQIWKARTEAVLETKKVLDMVLTDHLETAATQVLAADTLKMAEDRAVIMQGLGETPMKMVLGVKGNQFRMWKRLEERYAVSNVATKVQLQKKLSRIRYKGQGMEEYIKNFEGIINRLKFMDFEVGEGMKLEGYHFACFIW